MPSCAERGSVAIAEALRLELAVAQVDVNVRELCCFGRCADGPNARLAPDGRFWRGVVLADVPVIVAEIAILAAAKNE